MYLLLDWLRLTVIQFHASVQVLLRSLGSCHLLAKTLRVSPLDDLFLGNFQVKMTRCQRRTCEYFPIRASPAALWIHLPAAQTSHQWCLWPWCGVSGNGCTASSQLWICPPLVVRSSKFWLAIKSRVYHKNNDRHNYNLNRFYCVVKKRFGSASEAHKGIMIVKLFCFLLLIRQTRNVNSCSSCPLDVLQRHDLAESFNSQLNWAVQVQQVGKCWRLQ